MVESAVRSARRKTDAQNTFGSVENLNIRCSVPMQILQPRTGKKQEKRGREGFGALILVVLKGRIERNDGVKIV